MESMERVRLESLAMNLEMRAQGFDERAKENRLAGGQSWDWLEGIAEGIRQARGAVLATLADVAELAESAPTYTTPEGFITWD
jgi:hypothetical protein